MDKLIRYLPFSYFWSHCHFLTEQYDTVLDLGCGSGRFTNDLLISRKWNVTGVDIYPKQLQKAAQYPFYRKLVKQDINRFLEEEIKNNGRYNLVLASQVIEHLSKKDAEKMLRSIDKIASKQILITTPNEFMEQPSSFAYKNKHQKHLSGWSVGDFEKRGYKVYGIGWGKAWQETGWARSSNLFMRYTARLISFILSPLFYYYPEASAGLIAIKTIKE